MELKTILFIFILSSQIQVFGQETLAVLDQNSIAKYNGGTDEYREFLSLNLQIPDSVKKGLVEGTVFLKLTISENGSVIKSEIERGIKGCEKCNKEVLRVGKLLPKFSPGTKDNKPTVSFAYLPVPFKKP